MSSSSDALKNLKWDKRMQEWMVNNGQITKEELQKHLDSLPDLADKVDLLRMERDQNSNGETH